MSQQEQTQLQDQTLWEAHPQEKESERVQCDACSARAQVIVTLPYGTLSFCHHHYNQHANVLTEQAGVAKLLNISQEQE